MCNGTYAPSHTSSSFSTTRAAIQFSTAAALSSNHTSLSAPHDFEFGLKSLED